VVDKLSSDQLIAQYRLNESQSKHRLSICTVSMIQGSVA